MNEELTPWHDGSVKPVHIGVYERYYDTRAPAKDDKPQFIGFAYWDGQVWHFRSFNIRDAKTERYALSQNLHWRGLANKPE